MKHYLSGSLLALLFLLTVGCSHREPAVLRQAEALMQSHPDSALALLQTCNRRQLSGRTLARYALLYTMAQNRSLIEVRSDSLLSIAYDYYLRHPSDTLAPRAHLYMGRYYAMCDSTKRAEDCLRQCIRLCETHKDYYTEYLALDCISDCDLGRDPQLAVTYAKQAYQVYMEKCSPIIYNEVVLLLRLAGCYNLLNETDSALLCAEKSYHLADSAGDSELLSDVFQDFAQIYEVKGDISTSLFYAKKAWENSTHKSSSLIWSLARKYYLADSISEAKTLLTDLLQMQSNSASKYVAYKTLADIKAKELDNKDIATYTDSACLYIEKMYQEAMSENVEYGKESFQMQIEKERLSRKSQRNIFLIVIIIFVLLFTLLLFYIRMSYAKRKIKNEKEKRMTSQRLQALEREKRMAEEALYREQIKGHEERLNMLRNFLLQKIDVMRKIKQSIKAKENLILSKRDWDEMEFVLNEADNNFINRLNERFPMLNQEDMQLCMLLRMDIDNKSIENLLFLSSQYVKQKQTILKKKMGLGDIPFSLRQYLEGF